VMPFFWKYGTYFSGVNTGKPSSSMRRECGPAKARNFPGTIQVMSPFSTRSEKS